MLNWFTEFSLAQRWLILGVTLLLAALGVRAFQQLPIDAFPDVSTTQVKLILKAPGMTPEEVEARITQPVETELLGIPNQTVLRSVSKYALADITLDFAEGTDIYWARSQVAERFANVKGDLPDNVGGGLAPISTPLSEMFMFTIEGDLSLQEKRTLLDWTIRPQLRALPGVADVNALGGRVTTFSITPDLAALNARHLTLDDLRTALEANTRNDGAGRVNEGEETWVVRIEGGIQQLDDLRHIAIKSLDGVPVTVGDVAKVELGELTRYGAVTQNGQGEAVEGLVLSLRGANAGELIKTLKAKLAAISATLPSGVTIEPFYDRSNLVDKAIHTVSKALLEAAVLVGIILFAFLGNVRAALVVALILPLSVLGTFILMRQFGLSANLMSLGGLAIAIGLLVDAAVVIVENIVAHLAHDNENAKTPQIQKVLWAVQEVSAPVSSGILIIAIVFLPLLTLEGLEGKLFAPVALTIVFALSASLLFALTTVPVMASWLLKQASHTDPWLLRMSQWVYIPLLDGALKKPWPVYLLTAVFMAGAIATYPFIGKTFMPVMDEGDLIVQLEKLPSISLEQSVATDLKVQQALLEQVPEIQRIVARVGSDELGLDPMGLNDTDSFLVLKPLSEWRTPDKEWLQEQIRQVLETFPGVAYNFTQPIDMRVSEMLTGSRGDVAIKLFGADLNTLNGFAQQIATLLEKIPGATDVYTQQNDGVQYLKAEIDRAAAGRFGLTVDDIAALLRTQLEGETIGTIQQEGRRIPLQLRGAAELRNAPTALQQIRLTLADGRVISLDQVAKLVRTDGPVGIKRENAARFVSIQSNVSGRDLVSFVEEAQQAVAAQVKLPAGYSVTWGGQFENQQRAAQRLMVVVPLALLLIGLLLFLTFRDLRQTVLVMANVPLALIGGIFSLGISGQYLSVPASVGFIALLGIAVLNGVVLVTFFNQLHQQGYRGTAVVREGALRRLRPVLMTASIATWGLVPLLFATGPGSEIQKPLATVVIGGLVSSTTLTLILLPLLYRQFVLKGEKSRAPTIHH
ncbi:MAG TPA: CusA/CzcA family heavy metal efflux RND transporter [Candidatus Thiothrix moscowensis]|mgnify:CR=1 FL=1|uniref:efflux RND transporter permease subunit n=1 Tax=unclassified Thiothrix TaxID=2636184 RepID=UPI0025DE5384|nr:MULTISPECIES: CusA/CzcA family heavy metal efflux RND transporter [unclassified Thiothrix]HRJ53187.1 CusA/CzcA family heavy metal efflux RND transporter [Candidatus Thiothrix moscowensis]HRJ93243.1 CusA/CzcA family heavy metal efflux RND transporter [Candidatus Thiothrix moscowensis]